MHKHISDRLKQIELIGLKVMQAQKILMPGKSMAASHSKKFMIIRFLVTGGIEDQKEFLGVYTDIKKIFAQR